MIKIQVSIKMWSDLTFRHDLKKKKTAENNEYCIIQNFRFCAHPKLVILKIINYFLALLEVLKFLIQA